MIKQKLIDKRREKGISQSEMAYQLNIEQPQYCRRENGKTRISKKEWDEMAKILDVSLDEIYEPHDGVYIMNNETSASNDESANNVYTFLILLSKPQRSTLKN